MERFFNLWRGGYLPLAMPLSILIQQKSVHKKFASEKTAGTKETRRMQDVKSSPDTSKISSLLSDPASRGEWPSRANKNKAVSILSFTNLNMFFSFIASTALKSTRSKAVMIIQWYVTFIFISLMSNIFFR